MSNNCKKSQLARTYYESFVYSVMTICVRECQGWLLVVVFALRVDPVSTATDQQANQAHGSASLQCPFSERSSPLFGAVQQPELLL